MSEFLPFALPDIGEEEIESVCESLRSGWLTTGPTAKRFEDEFAEFVGARHALAVNSCTAGMHLALDAVGIGPGDKVLTTDYTFTATAEVIRYVGADPVFVDIDPDTLNMDVNAVAAAVADDPSIRAIIPVHLAGLACDMRALAALARKHGIPIIEDAAHALPTIVDGQLIGSLSELSVFSFYVTKTLATGEGGMVVTDNPDLAERIRVMRLHGISQDVFDRYTSNKPSWYYEVIAPGFKYNMPDIAAAIGVVQLKRVWELQRRREAIARRYNDAFRELPLQLPSDASHDDTHAWHLYIVRLMLEEISITRDEFIEKMIAAGVGVSVHFIPLHLHPYWRDTYQLTPQQYPVAHAMFKRVVSLPIYTKMTDSDVERVIATVHTVLREAMR
jgi:dTDP-4-amino-4,6-dideoxygalactose transaminase